MAHDIKCECSLFDFGLISMDFLLVMKTNHRRQRRWGPPGLAVDMKSVSTGSTVCPQASGSRLRVGLRGAQPCIF
jgi:hypothetical protein